MIDFAPEAQSPCGPFAVEAKGRAVSGNASAEGGNASAEGAQRGVAAHFWGTGLAFYWKFVPLRLIGLVYVCSYLFRPFVFIAIKNYASSYSTRTGGLRDD